jgi:hypothetical protein
MPRSQLYVSCLVHPLTKIPAASKPGTTTQLQNKKNQLFPLLKVSLSHEENSVSFKIQ